MDDPKTQALVFGEVADIYHDVRPRYPEAVVADTLRFGPVAVPGRALDVGAGTGIATALFASAGLTVTALEPNEEMADVARSHLPDDVRFVSARFEDWEIDDEFDLVFSAQAWHWIEPTVGFAKAHRALGGGGVLALIWNLEEGEQPGRPVALDAVYDRYAPDMTGKATEARLRPPDELSAGLVATELFDEPSHIRYPHEVTYSTHDFLQLQMTHSPKRLLPAHRRSALLADIAAAVDGAGGAVTIRYTTNLFLAHAM